MIPYTFGSAEYGGLLFISEFMKGIIYKATNLYNGLSYIGQTRATLEKRKTQHLNGAVTDSVNHFHLALMQYGDSGFKWEILDEFSGSKEEVIHALNVAEEYHILRLRTRLSEYGYNATQGGYSSDKFDDAIKKRALANYGGKAVLQYDLDGNFVREYESIAEVCRVFGIKNKHKGCYFLGRKWKGYQWREKINEYFPRKISPWQSVVKKGFTPLLVYNIDGMLYRRYESVKACWSDLGFNCRVRDSFDDTDIRIPGKGVLVFRDKGYAPEKISVNVIRPKEKREKIDCRKAVVQYDRDGNYVAEYASLNEAHRATGCSVAHIRESTKKDLPYKVDCRCQNIWRNRDNEIARVIDVYQEKKMIALVEPKKEHRIIQYGRDGKLVKIWETASDAVSSGIVTWSELRRHFTGKRLSKDKHQWVRYDDSVKNEIEPIIGLIKIQQLNSGREHRVLQYSKDGALIKIWGNMYQASLQTGESHSLIRKQCMNLPTKKKTSSIWKYYTPDYAQTIEVA